MMDTTCDTPPIETPKESKRVKTQWTYTEIVEIKSPSLEECAEQGRKNTKNWSK